MEGDETVQLLNNYVRFRASFPKRFLQNQPTYHFASNLKIMKGEFKAVSTTKLTSKKDIVI